ncbi:radical SAM protein [Tautonia sp. JC769]|uniref:radical SAM protein n=1 Tax=Tautonia sp. JC769 TaxID=3232135 RepID=UPI003457EA91
MQTLIERAHARRPADTAAEHLELRRRMARPQRHRLLHGYPLAAAMPRRDDSGDGDRLDYRPDRGLLIGVLPHPFCNPAVAGCGFCTFPHEAFSGRKAEAVVDRVIREIDRRVQGSPAMARRRVAGLYFGGGTANLTPPRPFRDLCRALSRAFDLSEAEVTLEGVPAAFVNRKPSLADILVEELAARHYRLSMGIQTFDLDQLRRMGRLGFGDANTFAEVVRLAHQRGFTASADLLFNLPGQSLHAMRTDVRRAVDLGLDHLGLYHLVMFPGLGTAWSRDPALVASLPPNEIAAENWRDLRGFLEGCGFYQATLTNFERQEHRDRDRRFVYEEFSFRPESHDMIGFGPGGISFAQHGDRAVKWMNPDGSSVYATAVDRGEPIHDRAFSYGPDDLRILYMTRHLAALRIDRAVYRDRFGSDPISDFPAQFAALENERLVTVDSGAIRPTVRGMFYADSVASLLARRRLGRESIAGLGPTVTPIDASKQHDNAFGHM